MIPDDLRTLRGRLIRVGTSPRSGPVFVLARYDRARVQFVARSLHAVIGGSKWSADADTSESFISVSDLIKGFEDGIIHLLPRKDS